MNAHAGWTALHYAARRNQLPVVNALIEVHADLNVQTGNPDRLFTVGDAPAGVRVAVRAVVGHWRGPGRECLTAAAQQLASNTVETHR